MNKSNSSKCQTSELSESESEYSQEIVDSTESTEYLSRTLDNLTSRAEKCKKKISSTSETSKNSSETGNETFKLVNEMRNDILQILEVVDQLNKEITHQKKAIVKLGNVTSTIKSQINSVENATAKNSINNEFSKLQDDMELQMDFIKKNLDDKFVDLSNKLALNDISNMNIQLESFKSDVDIKISELSDQINSKFEEITHKISNVHSSNNLLSFTVAQSQNRSGPFR